MNSDKVIFSNEKASDFYLESLKGKALKFNSSRGSKINELPEKRNEDGTYSVIMHNQKKDIDIDLNLSFIKLTSGAKAYKMTGYVAELKNEDLRNKKNS